MFRVALWRIFRLIRQSDIRDEIILATFETASITCCYFRHFRHFVWRKDSLLPNIRHITRGSRYLDKMGPLLRLIMYINSLLPLLLFLLMFRLPMPESGSEDSGQ